MCTHLTAFQMKRSLIKRTALDKSLIDHVCLGTVLQEVRTSNVAREVRVSHLSYCQFTLARYLLLCLPFIHITGHAGGWIQFKDTGTYCYYGLYISKSGVSPILIVIFFSLINVLSIFIV